MNKYIVGQTIFLRARLSDPSTGDPSDPATQNPVDDPSVVMTVYRPDGTTVTPPLTHGATGVYTAVITPDISGIYKPYTLATGTATGAGEDRFYVAPVP